MPRRTTTTKRRRTPALPAVRVRMFRQGLGDCFLLTFNLGADEQHVLIDCGSLGATTTGVSLETVAGEIKTATGNHLSLLIGTHEHWDHVGGFMTEREVFERMKIDHVWLGWTENPRDELAQQLARRKHDIGMAMVEAHAALQVAAATGDPRSASALAVVAALAEFNGHEELPPGGALGLSSRSAQAMEWLRTRSGIEPEYQEPGGPVLEPGWLPGFRIYVLGPPRDAAKLAATGEHGDAEIYGITSGLRVGVGSKAGPVEARPGNEEVEREMPVGARFRWPLADPAIRGFYPSYHTDEAAWRRIDGDWLGAAAEAAENLALQLDHLTNNTSLALAIERIADGKVLLFPADAQEGNWLSWHDPAMTWQVTDRNGKAAQVRAEDLLRRTVFYKVAHHASHNATAKAKGLELMPSTGLTAFIPVDRQVALRRAPKGSWQMPARVLYRRLLEKCEGRVVRSDVGWAAGSAGTKRGAVEQAFERLATPTEWKAWGRTQSTAGEVSVSDRSIDFILR